MLRLGVKGATGIVFVTKHAVISASLFTLASIHLPSNPNRPRVPEAPKIIIPKYPAALIYTLARQVSSLCFCLPFISHLSYILSFIILLTSPFLSLILIIISSHRSHTALYLSPLFHSYICFCCFCLLCYAWHSCCAPLLNAFLNSPSSSSTTCFKNISTN